MSNKQPKTNSSHQKKAQNKTERLEEKEEEANMLTVAMLAQRAAGILAATTVLKNIEDIEAV